MTKIIFKMEDDGVIIFGASGFIGGHLFDFLKKHGKKVTGTGYKTLRPDLIEFDVTKDSIGSLNTEGIKYGIICSAIAKEDECKKNSEYSYNVNVVGLKRIIRELSDKNIIPVFMSGASVFGECAGCREEDYRNPITSYGKQKKEVEDFIISNIRNYLIIRPGKVFGIKEGEGGLFADWLSKYKNNEIIYCLGYDDETLSITYVGDLVRAINILLDENSKGIFHIDSQKPYSRFELANDFFSYLGIKDTKIKKCSIDELNLLEKRPKSAYLDNSKLLKKTGFKFTPLKEIYGMIAK